MPSAFAKAISSSTRAIKNSHFVRIPINYFKYFAQIKKLEEEYGEGLTDEILLENLNITSDTLEVLKKNRDTKVYIEDLEYALEHSHPSDDECIESVVSKKELKEYLLQKINELRPSHRDILYMKFFGNDDNITLEQMGNKRGVTRERIRQLIPQALKSLRRKIEEDRMFFELNNDSFEDPSEHNRRSRSRSRSSLKRKLVRKIPDYLKL